MRSKYRNIKSKGYHSRKESRRAQELKLMERSGEISELQEQPVYVLIESQEGERPVKYIADFKYIRDSELVVEDVKSSITRKNPDYIIKRKLMLKVHGIRVLET